MKLMIHEEPRPYTLNPDIRRVLSESSLGVSSTSAWRGAQGQNACSLCFTWQRRHQSSEDV